MKKTTMIEHFSLIEDPRIDRTRKHKLIDILVIAVCGVISSCENWVDIEEYGKTKIDWFKKILDLPNGIPSHDTFARVFSLLDSKKNFKSPFMIGSNRLLRCLKMKLLRLMENIFQHLMVPVRTLRNQFLEWLMLML